MDHRLISLIDGGALWADTGPLLLSSHVRAAALLLLCFYLLKSFGRSASFRHLLISSILTGLLLLPLFSFVIPAVDVMVEVTRSELTTAPAESAEAIAVAILAEQGWNLGDYLSCAILLYGLGLLFNLGRQLWATSLVTMVSWVARPVRDASWLQGLERAKTQLGVRRRVDLRYSRIINSPMTWGAVKPVVLLPASAKTWSRQLIHSALLHELAHIKRYDWLTQQVARVACAFYWPNPLCWRALRRLEDNAEAACDDLVLAAGVRGTHYASDLIHVAWQVCSGSRIPSGALAMSVASEPSQLASRVNAILNPSISRKPNRFSHAVLTLGLVAFVLLPLASLRANYVEVPVFAPDKLTPFTSIASVPEMRNGSSPADNKEEPAQAAFDREAVKRLAVTELRGTIAKINASTREWLETDSVDDGDTPVENDTGGTTKVDTASNDTAEHKPQVSETSEASEETTADVHSTSQPQPSASEPTHPLLALLRQMEEKEQARERYVHTRLVKPEYPRRALERGVEGEVRVSFNIDENGRVLNPRILQADPAGVFDKQVLRAVEQFEYKPNLVDGQAVPVEGASEVFRFVLKS